ncbi:MAG: queuosine precursor transporter [Deltaproteobacteria bacterium]
MLSLRNRNGEFSGLFLTIACLFVSCLLISNIIAGKLITVHGLILPAAVILFPVTYIFGDVMTEVYGFKRARLVIWIGFACNLLMALVFLATIALPSPSFWSGQSAYAAVLGTTPRIVMASLLGYFLGEWSNAAILSRMKIMTEGRWLWTRTISSTIVGEGLDTIIFIGIAFWGTLPLMVLGQMMLAQYLWKVIYEVLLTPLTYGIVGKLKQKEDVDIFDNNVNYNPFRLG